jgi:nucleotide-binding universal stress UspA family protein
MPGTALRHERVVHQCCDDTADTLLDAFRGLRPDLIVSATHARSGVARLLSGSVAEAVARNAAGPTLLLPIHCRGFVSHEDGRLRLQRVLVPAGSVDETEQAIDAAFALALDAGQRELEIVLLHVADGRPAPTVALPRGWRLTPRAAAGPLAPAIIDAARELRPDLVVMATHGHDGIVDVLLGSVTERVLHGLACPLLWVLSAWRRQVGRS